MQFIRGMTGKTRRTTASQGAIASQIEEEILSGHLEAGARLPSERVLAARLGVSRPVIREVLRTLAERRLLEVSPGRGTFAREILPSDVTAQMTTVYRRRNATIRDLIEARMMVEIQTARLACSSASERDTTELREAAERVDQAGDILEKARADVAFHSRLAQASCNPVIETMFMSIIELVFEHILRSSAQPGITEEGNPFHHTAVEAISRHDPEAAVAAIRAHLEVSLRLYGTDLDSSVEHLARLELDRMRVSGSLRPGFLALDERASAEDVS
jgi:GntR family transcriptional repressor for pyruvate dehydrogenase complex